MKRLLSVILVLALLMLPVQAGAASTFQFTRENFPRMDGSTSLVPLGTGITSVLLGLDREEAGALVQFNRTTQSFRNLQEGYCDIVIAAEPKSQVFDEMEQAHFGYEIQQIATEALVFVVNEDNPVDNLTTGQLQDIYAGEITNWAQVGGNDAPIEAFQRNATAGSQVMMEKLVMQGKPMMEVPTAMVPGAMAALIEAVKNYDNSANAIGYTVYVLLCGRYANGLRVKNSQRGRRYSQHGHLAGRQLSLPQRLLCLHSGGRGAGFPGAGAVQLAMQRGGAAAAGVGGLCARVRRGRSAGQRGERAGGLFQLCPQRRSGGKIHPV